VESARSDLRRLRVSVRYLFCRNITVRSGEKRENDTFNLRITRVSLASIME